MSKFLDGNRWCLYLDQFAVSRVFDPSPSAEWVSIAALIKSGISSGKILYPNSIEQAIETTGLDKEYACFLDSEARKFSLGWSLFTEADISVNYLICKVRQREMTKHHFVHKSKQNCTDMSEVYEEISKRQSTFKGMVKDATETVNSIRMITREGVRAKKDGRDSLVEMIKALAVV